MAAPDVNNADTTFLQRWFVQTGQTEFEDYNSIMSRMETENVVGEDKTTNFLTERWIATMIAIEATAVVAFLTIQSAFMTAAKTIMHVLQLDFSGAFQNLKANGYSTIIALKVTISMVPLILIGFLAPSTAYKAVAEKLAQNIEDAKIAAGAAEAELDEIKEKIAPYAGKSKEALAKMDASQVETALNAEKTKAANTLTALLGRFAAAVDLDANAAEAAILAKIATLKGAGDGVLLPIDILLAEAVGKELPTAALAEGVRKGYIAQLKTARESLAAAEAKVAELAAKVQTHEETIRTLTSENEGLAGWKSDNSAKVSGYADLESEVRKLQRELSEKGTTHANALAQLSKVDEQLRAQLKAAGEELQAANSALEPVRAENATQKTRIQSLEKEFQTLTELQAQTKASLAEALKPKGDGEADPTADLRTKVQELNEQIAAQKTTLEGEKTQIQTRLDEVSRLLETKTTEYTQLNDEFREYKARIAEEKQRAEQAAADQKKLVETQMKELEERIQPLDTEVTKLKEAARTTTLEHEAAVKLEREAKEEAAKALETAQQNVQTLTEAKEKAEAELQKIREATKLEDYNETAAADLAQQVKTAEEEVATIQEELDKANAHVTKLQSDVAHYVHVTANQQQLIALQLEAQKLFTPGQIGVRSIDTLTKAPIIATSTDSPVKVKNTGIETSFVWTEPEEKGDKYQPPFFVSGRTDEYVSSFVEANRDIDAADGRIGAAKTLLGGDLNQLVAEGKLAPIPTGVPIANEAWAEGVNYAISTAVFNAEGHVLVLDYEYDDPVNEGTLHEQCLLTAAAPEHLTAVTQEFPHSAVFNIDELRGDQELQSYDDELAPMPFDPSSTNSTDVTWSGKKAGWFQLTGDAGEFEAKIKAQVEGKGYTIKWVDLEQPGDITHSGQSQFEVDALKVALTPVEEEDD